MWLVSCFTAPEYTHMHFEGFVYCEGLTAETDGRNGKIQFNDYITDVIMT